MEITNKVTRLSIGLGIVSRFNHVYATDTHVFAGPGGFVHGQEAVSQEEMEELDNLGWIYNRARDIWTFKL